MLARETAYDEVFDAQRHYRVLLDCMARPGKVGRLERVALDPPAGLHPATALVAFGLLDADTSFAVEPATVDHAAYLAANTNAHRTEVPEAQFLFTNGEAPAEVLDGANCGSLLYPDTAATVLLQIVEASVEPLTGGLKLELQGPGIPGTRTIFVRGLSEDMLLALQARNAEFPLGLDAILTFNGAAGEPCLMALPRTTRVAWETV